MPQPELISKNAKKVGETPAIALINPKYPRNVGAAVRAASCFGVRQVWFTGNRVPLISEKGKYRLPREARMKAYNEVDLINFDYFLEQFERGVTPVAIELTPGAENILEFEHPEKAIYLFGPEDGSIGSVWLQHCHRFVFLPTFHCTNLGAAVYMTLYDRLVKKHWNGDYTPLPLDAMLKENRGWAEDLLPCESS